MFWINRQNWRLQSSKFSKHHHRKNKIIFAGQRILTLTHIHSCGKLDETLKKTISQKNRLPNSTSRQVLCRRILPIKIQLILGHPRSSKKHRKHSMQTYNNSSLRDVIISQSLVNIVNFNDLFKSSSEIYIRSEVYFDRNKIHKFCGDVNILTLAGLLCFCLKTRTF